MNSLFDMINLYQIFKSMDIMKNIVFVNYSELKGLSQVKLARQLGICRDYVNMVENN